MLQMGWTVGLYPHQAGMPIARHLTLAKALGMPIKAMENKGIWGKRARNVLNLLLGNMHTKAPAGIH